MQEVIEKVKGDPEMFNVSDWVSKRQEPAFLEDSFLIGVDDEGGYSFCVGGLAALLSGLYEEVLPSKVLSVTNCIDQSNYYESKLLGPLGVTAHALYSAFWSEELYSLYTSIKCNESVDTFFNKLIEEYGEVHCE